MDIKNLLIGPAGNSAAFYATGRKSTLQAPAWLAELGLTAFEYSFGRGVNMRDQTAIAIGEQMRLHGIMPSVHAPYYINLASTDDQAFDKAYDYLARSLHAVLLMGGHRVIFHSGNVASDGRPASLARVATRLVAIADRLATEVQEPFFLCPETMGKYSQIGSLAEILSLCTLHPRLLPCLDIGHLNCLAQGALTTEDDYRRIFDTAVDTIGPERTGICHIHFSHIQFGRSGEIRHLDFSDKVFGPDYRPLAAVIEQYSLTPTIICESRENMSDDALTMQSIHRAIRAQKQI